MKCANNYNQPQKKKRKHDSSDQSGRNANHLTTSIMVVNHIDRIKHLAIKGSCNSYEGGIMLFCYWLCRNFVIIIY